MGLCCPLTRNHDVISTSPKGEVKGVCVANLASPWGEAKSALQIWVRGEFR